MATPFARPCPSLQDFMMKLVGRGKTPLLQERISTSPCFLGPCGRIEERWLQSLEKGAEEEEIVKGRRGSAKSSDIQYIKDNLINPHRPGRKKMPKMFFREI